MIVGLGVTFGFTFSELNVKLKLGLDETKEGWSPALIGLCFNLIGESHMYTYSHIYRYAKVWMLICVHYLNDTHVEIQTGVFICVCV